MGFELSNALCGVTLLFDMLGDLLARLHLARCKELFFHHQHYKKTPGGPINSRFLFFDSPSSFCFLDYLQGIRVYTRYGTWTKTTPATTKSRVAFSGRSGRVPGQRPRRSHLAHAPRDDHAGPRIRQEEVKIVPERPSHLSYGA